MSRIIIDNRYEIVIDGIGNHTLVQHGRTDKGVSKVVTIGYYKNVGSALKKYIDLEVAEPNDVLILGDYIKRYEMAVDRVMKGKR